MSTTTSPPLPQLPVREASSHKGTFGTALVIGGSRGMSGAITLTGQAALRGGAGLVFVACPESCLQSVAISEPAYLTFPLPEDAAGMLGPKSLSVLQERLDSCTAAAIGPGLGQSPSVSTLVEQLYRETPQPLVVDADALNALAAHPQKLAEYAGPRILTPHPGEMARLAQTTTQDVQENREVLAREFAQEHQCVLVLKGHQTIITDGKRLAVNPTGNPGMATGGTGDVLTGLICSLLAQGLAPFEAAQLGAYVHGRAGDLAAEEFGLHGLISSDLPRYIAYALKEQE